MNATIEPQAENEDAPAVGAFFSCFPAGVEGAVLAIQALAGSDFEKFRRVVATCCALIEGIQADPELSSKVAATATFAEKVARLAAPVTVMKQVQPSEVRDSDPLKAASTLITTKPLPASSAVGKFLHNDNAENPPPALVKYNLGEEDGDIRELLALLPHNSLLPPVYDALIESYPSVTKKTRHGSRGNAVLYILSKFARKRILSLDEVVFGLKQMQIFEIGTSLEESQRAAAWEINNLIRNGWPIRRFPRRGFQFLPAEETAV